MFRCLTIRVGIVRSKLTHSSQINRKLDIKTLTSLGYQILIAEDGQEAIEQIVQHDHTIDAILIDQSMPRKDGLTATKEIRAMEAAGTLSLEDQSSPLPPSSASKPKRYAN
jgi:CheY-like chemotaxis protein